MVNSNAGERIAARKPWHAVKNTLTNKVLSFALGLFAVGLQSATAQTWTPIASAAPHYNAGVMILLTDGTVLCKTSSGGPSGGQGIRWDKLTPDASGSYVNGTWTTIAPMADDRLYFSAQVLRDGRLYIAGGEYGNGGDNSEVYDPLTDAWTPCPSIITGLPGISDANSEILPDGKVLQAVVSAGTKKNYIWDPATNTYTPAANCLRTDNEAPWSKLPDQSIIFVDAYGTSAERYIPSTGTWFNEGGAGTVPVSLFDPFGSEAGGAYLLPDGRVFFIGSKPTSAYYTPSGSPSVAGTWTAGPPIPGAYGAPDAASAMMVDGTILLALSPEPRPGNHFPDSTAFYVFDYTTNIYTPIPAPYGVGPDTLSQPCFVTNMLVLPDGTILFANQGDDQYYEYKPAGAPLAAGKPTINNIIENTCTSFTITGTLFNGISEGSVYGDDWQNETNFPLVRLKSGTNVWYARTTNWNSTGVMRGSAPDTAQFALPAGLPLGTYQVEVVVNGNPSATYSLTTGPANISPVATTVCKNSTVTLTPSITGGTWASSSSGIASVGSASGVVLGAGAGTATITYGLGTCTSVATVTVLPLPAAITTGGVTDICAGTTTSFSDASTGGVWNSSASSIAGVSGGTVSGSSAGTATISYTLGGCSVTAPINVNPLPASITGTMGACLGFTSALNDADFGGSWASSNTAVATVGSSSGIVTAATAGTSTIVYTLPTGCATSAVFATSSTTTPVTGTKIVCPGGTTTLSDATPSGTWTSSNPAVANIGSSSGIVSAIGLGTSVITYSLNAGCFATATVTVDLSATVPASLTITASPGSVMCSAGPVTFTPHPVNGGSAPVYKWYVNGTLSAAGGSYAYTPATGDIVKCVVTSNASCVYPDTAIASATMTVLPVQTPSVSITAFPAGDVCAGIPVAFTATPVAGGSAPSYLWTKNSIAVGTGAGYVYAPANGDVIKCTLTSSYPCATAPTAASNSITTSVTTPDVNSVTIKVARPTIYTGQLDTFTAIAPYGGASPVYQWYVNGVAMPGETKVTFITNKLKSGDIVKCAVTSSLDCVNPVKALSGGISIKVTGGNGVHVTEIESANAGFTLVPNPNNGMFTISGSLVEPANDRIDVIVTNMLGQVVFTQQCVAANGVLEQRIALPANAANGTYMVSVTSGAQHAVFHMVVDK